MTPRELEVVFRAALEQMDLERRVADALPVRRPRSAHLIAIGKAAPAMARGAIASWGDAIEQAIVVTTDDTATTGLGARVAVLRAGHPLPDRRSVAAADRCLALAARPARYPDGVLLVLVSGGASALVCAPALGVTLAQKRACTRALLHAGASIQEINVVRKHLSRIKGGALARASALPVVTVVASDVIDGDAADVGSGPSVSDASTVADARRILRRYASGGGGIALVKTGAAPRARKPIIVASPEELARAVARRLRQHGLRVRNLPSSQADVEDLAREYATLARTLRPGYALVRAAEPSLSVSRRAGEGGRSTHLATRVAPALPPGVTFLAGATDGVDGTSGTGGVIVDATFATRTDARRVANALAGFDTGPLHREAGTALPLRPSGHNLADLHVLVRS